MENAEISPYIVQIILGIIAAVPGIAALVAVLLRSKRENAKLASESNQIEANTDKTQAETMQAVLAAAKDAAEQVIQKSSVIKELERCSGELASRVRVLEDDKITLQMKVAALESDKRRLEEVRDQQTQKIESLTKRVKKLESLLNDHSIPIPPTLGVQ